MSESSRLVALNTGRSLPLRCIAGAVVATMCVVPVASRRAKGDSQQSSVVARVDPKSAELTSRDIVVRVENVNVPATAIKDVVDTRRNIAIVIDAGPDQAKVLSKEKELAIALINELSNVGTSFTVASAGISSKMQSSTVDRARAIEHILEITGDNGGKETVPIYDALGSVIRQISLTPGLRIVIFVGEGNDGGSRLRYAELRNLAESNQISFFCALVADHSLRGAKSILRYGWNLQDLTDDTAGIFLENQKLSEATRRLNEGVQSLRLIALEMPSMQSGRYRISVSVRGKRLRAQKIMVIP